MALRSLILSALPLAAILFAILAARAAIDYQLDKESFAPQWRTPEGLAKFFGFLLLLSLGAGLACAWIARQPWAAKDQSARHLTPEWLDPKTDDWVDWIMRIIAIAVGIAGLIFVLWLEKVLRR